MEKLKKHMSDLSRLTGTDKKIIMLIEKHKMKNSIYAYVHLGICTVY